MDTSDRAATPAGRLEAIFVGSVKNQPLQSVQRAALVAGAGIVGDRKNQSNAKHPDPSREVTLIEAEAIEGARRDYGLQFAALQSRRNLLTRGVALNHLVGSVFQVGQVRLRGIRLCEPCGHLEKLTIAGIREALIHRGGLMAEVLQGGLIQIGDPVIVDPT
jgi:MOSC domain-containing protein YiiM